MDTSIVGGSKAIISNDECITIDEYLVTNTDDYEAQSKNTQLAMNESV